MIRTIVEIQSQSTAERIVELAEMRGHLAEVRS